MNVGNRLVMKILFIKYVQTSYFIIFFEKIQMFNVN